MRIEASFGGLASSLNAIERDIARSATEAMRETTPIAKQALRDQVIGAGLGSRLANTWRGETYPKSADSVNPAGYIWTNAPDIIDAFERGATIVPLGGHHFLAIPTKAVPRSPGAGRARSTKRMTPLEVEATFNQDLFFRPGKLGRVLAFINAPFGRRGSGSSGRPVLMFTLVPLTKLLKLLELQDAAIAWAQDFETTFANRLEAS